MTRRDVKNEDRPDYVHENKANTTKCHAENTAFYTKMHPLNDNQQKSVGLIGRKCADYAINQGEAGMELLKMKGKRKLVLATRPRQLLENIHTRQIETCKAQRKAILKESVKGPSPYERAAEIAPTFPQRAAHAANAVFGPS